MSSEPTLQEPLAASRQGLEPFESKEPFDEVLRIVSVLYRAVRQASELQRFAEEARGTDDELRAFFERCACTETERAIEAKRLLMSRALTPGNEVVTSAAFAAGDGATDADVAPSSERRSVRVWPGQ